MKKKWENVLIFLLPVLIFAAIAYNARVMSNIYMTENGLNQDSKICNARIMPDRYEINIKQGQKTVLHIVVANQGNFIWTKGGSQPVALSYHLLDSNKKMLVLDNPRTELPHDIRPDAEYTADVEISFNQVSGDYILEFDMVEEGVTWFGLKGSPTTLVKLHVSE